MDQLLFLIPIALFLGLVGLGAFLWSLKSGQFEDLDGAAHRILIDDDSVADQVAVPKSAQQHRGDDEQSADTPKAG